MAKFQYKGRDANGEALEGLVEADSTDAVASQLFNRGIIPVEITEAVDKENILLEISRKLNLNAPSLDDIIMFSRQMYTLQRAGVPIIQGIKGISQSAHNQRLKEVLEDIADQLDSGRSIAAAISQHPDVFSTLYSSVIEVGEESGSLEEGFLRIYEYLMREKDTRDRIKSAVRYPIVVLIAITSAVAVANFFVIPVFAKIYERFDAELPLVTRGMIAFSEFTITYWPVVLIGVVGAIVGFIRYINTEKGLYRWHRLILKAPAIGKILYHAALARFCRTFSITLRSGVPMIQGLMVVSRTVGNEYLSERMLSMRSHIENGESLARTADRADLFTPLIIQMIAVGEESGTVDEMLTEVADYYDREVDYDLVYLSDSLQPVLVVAMGILVLLLALGLFLPMWDMYGHILK